MKPRKKNPKQSREQVKDLWGKELAPDFPVEKTIKRSPTQPKAGNESGRTESVLPSPRQWPRLPIQSFFYHEEAGSSAWMNYDLQEILGEGGMGVVFSAVQNSVGREIALKILRSELLADQDASHRFVLEGQIAGKLDHPNILPIHELGQNQKGDLFIAMKKIKGQRWDKTFLNKKPRENLDIMLRVCDAVAYAHCKGIIHRDLKPENVMLGEFGEIIITDWGLAASLNPGNSGEGVLENVQAGTPAYMSPEVARCELSSLDFRSDVYLLGGMLYEVWTGKLPHVGKDIFECLEAAAANIIQPVEKKDEIVDIALKAMETEPEDRFASVQEFRHAIEDYLSHAESLNLTRSAREEFARAGSDYAILSRALALFEESAKVWPENCEAGLSIMNTRLHFASTALSRGDLNLAKSLLVPDNPAHQETLGKVLLAQEMRKSRMFRLKVVSVVFMGFALAVLVIILGMRNTLATERNEALAACDRLFRDKEEILRQLSQETALRKAFQLELGRKDPLGSTSATLTEPPPPVETLERK